MRTLFADFQNAGLGAWSRLNVWVYSPKTRHRAIGGQAVVPVIECSEVAGQTKASLCLEFCNLSVGQTRLQGPRNNRSVCLQHRLQTSEQLLGRLTSFQPQFASNRIRTKPEWGFVLTFGLTGRVFFDAKPCSVLINRFRKVDNTETRSWRRKLQENQ